MSMRDNTALTFETFQDRRHNYDFTHVVVRTMYRINTRAALEGTVDNKAGYGTEDAARRQGLLFQTLLDLGHEEHFDVCTFADLSIHLEWQHYHPADGGEMGYCDPHFEDLGRGFKDIEAAMKFLKRLGGSIERQRVRQATEAGYQPSLRSVSSYSFESPQRVLGALGRMKGSVQIQRLPGNHVWVMTDAKILSRAA